MSIHNRLNLQRRTFAALQTGSDHLRIQLWHESVSGDTEITVFPIKSKVIGLHLLQDSVLVLQENFNIIRLNLDLTTVIEEVAGSSYVDVASDRILNHAFSTEDLQPTDACKLTIIAANSELTISKIKFYPLQDETTLETEIFQTNILASQDLNVSVLSPQSIQIGPRGQVAIISLESKFVLLNIFGEAQTSFKPMHIPVSKDTKITDISFLWVSQTQFLIAVSNTLSLWNCTYKVLLSSITIPDNTSLMTLIPQKPTANGINGALLALSNLSEIRLTTIKFRKEVHMLDVLGRQKPPKRLAELWLEDVSIQATWKDSLAEVAGPARRCLSAVQQAQTGAEVDAIMEEYLFADFDKQYGKSKSERKLSRRAALYAGVESKGKKFLARKRKQQRSHGLNTSVSDNHADLFAERDTLSTGDGSRHKQTNGTTDSMTKNSSSAEDGSEVEETVLAAALQAEVATRTYSAKNEFTNVTTATVLSRPFVDRLLHIIFVEGKFEKGSFPVATIDFLLKSGLFSLSNTSEFDVSLETVLKSHRELRIPILEHAKGLDPSQVLGILATFLEDPVQLLRALELSLTRLGVHEEANVSMAIRARLSVDASEKLFICLGDELRERLETDKASSKLHVSNELLCAGITMFLDSFGVSNLFFSNHAAGVIPSIRESIAQLLQQMSQIVSVSSCVTGLLLKARLVEGGRVRTVPGQGPEEIENPEPEAKKSDMTFEKIKKAEKGQSQRAKAHARVQDIGSLYSIETLQI